MKKIKIFLLLLFFVFIISAFAQANELKINNQNNFSFTSHLKESTNLNCNNSLQNKIVNLKKSGGAGKVRGFTRMGGAGAAVFGISWVFMIGGIALLAYAYISLINAGLFAATSFMSLSTLSLYSLAGPALTSYYLLIGGAALLAVGLTMFWVGLPIMIVGYALAAYHRKKGRASLLIKTDIDNAQIYSGIAIKI